MKASVLLQREESVFKEAVKLPFADPLSAPTPGGGGCVENKSVPAMHLAKAGGEELSVLKFI